jgi:hypothetical protein
MAKSTLEQVISTLESYIEDEWDHLGIDPSQFEDGLKRLNGDYSQTNIEKIGDELLEEVDDECDED